MMLPLKETTIGQLWIGRFTVDVTLSLQFPMGGPEGPMGPMGPGNDMPPASVMNGKNYQQFRCVDV